MFRNRTRRSRWAVVAAAALTMLGAGLAAALPADAATGTTYPDHFEGNPYERWSDDAVPGYSHVWLGDLQKARKEEGGVGGVWFDAPSGVSARIYSRPLTLERPTRPGYCVASGYVRKTSESGLSPSIKLGVRAQGAPRGVFLDISTQKTNSVEYERVKYAIFPYTPEKVIIEISVTGGMAYFDDLAIDCDTGLQ